MNDHALHAVTSADIARTGPLGRMLLALNNAHAQELSWLEPERLEYLVGEAFLARRIGNLDAFLLAFDQGARYDSPNYLWFRNRYERSCMSTASSWPRRHADVAVRGGSIMTCSITRSAPDTTMFSAKSIYRRPIRSRTRSTRRWDLSRSAPPVSATGSCDISRAHYPKTIESARRIKLDASA
jgi:hypothetical protein